MRLHPALTTSKLVSLSQTFIYRRSPLLAAETVHKDPLLLRELLLPWFAVESRNRTASGETVVVVAHAAEKLHFLQTIPQHGHDICVKPQQEVSLATISASLVNDGSPSAILRARVCKSAASCFSSAVRRQPSTLAMSKLERARQFRESSTQL